LQGIIFARYWHFTVDPNNYFDPETDHFFDLIISNFVIRRFYPKLDCYLQISNILN
jgi:hypothetical protein